MKRIKREPSYRQRMAANASRGFPAPEKGDMAWMLLKYRESLQANPEQTLPEFLMNCGANGLMFRLWFSASHLFRAPDKYTCVWHGTSLNRAMKILERGFMTPTYTSFDPEVCMDYAERRSSVESDMPAIIACILEQLYVRKRTDTTMSDREFVVFQAFPRSYAKFVLVPPEEESSLRSAPLEIWRIYAQTPGLATPLQSELNALLTEWDFAVDNVEAALAF